MDRKNTSFKDMYPTILAGLTGIFGKEAIRRSLPVRVAGFLYGMVVAFGVLLGAAWDYSGDADGRGRVSRKPAPPLLTLSRPCVALLDRW